MRQFKLAISLVVYLAVAVAPTVAPGVTTSTSDTGTEQSGQRIEGWILWFFSCIVAAFIGGLIVNFLTVCKEAKGRRRAFRGYIRSVISELATLQTKSIPIPAGEQHGTAGERAKKAYELNTGLIQPGDLFALHTRLVGGVREQCARISEDIPDASQARFQRLWMQYCGLCRTDTEKSKAQSATDRPQDVFPTIDYDEGLQKMIGLLEGLIVCAKDRGIRDWLCFH
jgi:hypothetical protein